MRTRRLYSTYDRVARVFGPFMFPAENDEDAKRGFQRFVTNGQEINKDDYELYYLGEYDRIDGVVKGLDEPGHEFIIAGKDFGNVVKLEVAGKEEDNG